MLTNALRYLTAGLFGACLSASVHAGSYSHGKDIVDIAAASEDFETLVAAVQAAGLVDTLKGKGPFTVFAPTDEAFAKLPEGTLEALLADKAALTDILTYHVVPGKFLAADVVSIDSARTVQGQSISIDTRYGVRVDGVTVIATDIVASNGVIHVIDAVMLPAEKGASAGHGEVRWIDNPFERNPGR